MHLLNYDTFVVTRQHKKICFLFLFFIIFSSFTFQAQCVTATDCDGDGIVNSQDLDDDNDGILDCEENGLTSATVDNLFSTAGNASFIGTNEIQLTPNLNNQAGSSMSLGKIDFNNDFSFTIQVNLGNSNSGADGIAIVFHNDPNGVNTVGAPGEGIGARNINNGIAIEFDTYQNAGDLPNDHTQIKNTRTWTGLTGMTDLGNIETGQWYDVTFSWNANTNTLSYSFNGNLIINYTNDLVNNIFNGVSDVHFGFTASTGGARNRQMVRLLNPLCNYPFTIDTDDDGIPNHLDTDSDNDGCPDAIEAAGNYTAAEVTNTFTGASNGGSEFNFPTPVNNNGIPIAVGTTIGGNETVGQSASLSVTTAQEISYSPLVNTIVDENNNFTFSANASAISTLTFSAGNPDYTIPPAINTSGALTYNWFKNSDPSASLSSTENLQLNLVSLADAGDYTLVISGTENTCPIEQVFTLNVNALPTATNDTATVNENSPANTINVLTNDSFGNDGPNSGSISLPSGTSARGGIIALDNAGTPTDPTDDTILYTPLTNYKGNDSFDYSITDANGDVSIATVTVTVNEVYNCDDSPTSPAQGFNVFVEETLEVMGTETRGTVAVGENLSIKGDYNVASEDCGDFDTNGVKTGLLVGGRVNYPLNTVIDTTDEECNCGDPTIVNNGSFEQNVNTNSWTLRDEVDVPGWYTTATDNKIEIWRSGFQGKNAQEGNYIAEINANQRAALYQVICAEPGSVLNWSIWHRGRRGVDVAEVQIGGSLNSATTAETMSSGPNTWINYSGSYTVPAGENKVYFVFKSVSSQPFNNLSYGNLIDNFEVTKTTQGVCPPGGTNPSGLLTVVHPDYYTKIGSINGAVAWYFDELNAPSNVRVTPNTVYNSSSRIQMNSSSPAYGVDAGNNPVFESNLIDFSSAFQSLRTNATNMAANADNAVLEDNNGNSITNTGLPNHTEIFLNNGVNYLNISGTDLNSARIFEAQRVANSDRILIINVDAPGTFNWDVWEQRGFAAIDSPYVMYNFPNTTTLNIIGTEEIYGTIFAPYADLEKSVNKEDIYGQVIAKSFIHDGGVIHCQKFAATTTCPPIVGVAPTSSFDINVNPQCFVANDFVFTNTSNTGGALQPEAPITYLWDFGDGTTSTSMNAEKNYANEGIYTVTLTATNRYGTDTFSQQVEVLPVLEPIVSVVTVSTSGNSVVKSFNIENAASFSDWSWTLPGSGPGSGPGLLQNENPITFTFTEAGIFTVSVTATRNDCTITIDIPIIITSDQVTGGNNGGVESESLGDAISKIYVGRKKNSVPTEFVKSNANLYNKAKLVSIQPYQGKGQTMLDMFPTELVAGNVANVTSPTDILDYTIADEVLSVDFSIDGKTKGVVLGIKTSDKVYNHTKASCDRLRGAEILNVVPVSLEGYNFLMQGIKQRNGVVEYAISFAAAKNNNAADYNIQTNWYVNHYTKFNDMYNFQVWSTNPIDTQKLVKDIITNLKGYIPVTQTEVQKVPDTFAAKIFRDKSELVVLMRSTEEGQQVEVSMEEMYSETANNLKHRYNPFNSKLEKTLRIDVADGYEYDALIKVNGEIEDAFYHADGNWGLDYDKRYTKVLDYFVSNDFNREYQDEEHALNRNVRLKASSDNDYLTLYKSLLPGTLSADYTDYKYLSFTAKGSGLLELGMVKASIEDWKQQYRMMVDISEEERTYYVPFEAFSSVGNLNSIVADDLTTLTFTFLPVEANTTELDLEISDVKFTKTAVEQELVQKIEAFENAFMAYPNPSEGNVNLLLFSEENDEAIITLTDITGKTIFKASKTLSSGKNEMEFNFNVKPGVLLLKISSSKTDYGVQKIIFR